MQIGFIDSGVGGLSVYQCVSQLVDTSYTYLMDNKYLPYGEKSEQFIRQRLLQLSGYLIEQGCDLIVIACNTATTQAVEYLRQHFHVPFVGVVPAIKPAAAISKGQGFGVLATPATCQSEYLQELIKKFAPGEAVVKVGSSELVRLAEEKVWYHTDVSQQVADVLTVSALAVHCPSVLVLGCTHFPFLAAEITAVIGEHCQLLDTGAAIARRVEQLTCERSLPEGVRKQLFISTRELLPAQTARLAELGFDQYQCWSIPLT